MMKYYREIILDDWQKKVMNTKGNMCLRSGRQVGKSFIIARKAATYALNNPDKVIMVIAFTEKQANLLFTKILRNIMDIKKNSISKPKPTKHVINLKNGSNIYCYAAGDTGFGIMGYTIDLLIADEAAWIKEEVWNSIIPALAITRGEIWLLSTPFLSEGYYFDCFKDDQFTSFHQSSEDCPRKDEHFLEKQRKKLSKSKYAQMYLGEFVDDAYRIFNNAWIEKVCTIVENEWNPKDPDNTAIGIDVAGTGDDESTYEGLVRRDNKLMQFYHKVIEKPSNWITEMMSNIRRLNKEYDPLFGIDGGGLGSGVVHLCLGDDDLKRKTTDLNNAKRNIDADERQTTKFMKEAMYMNMLAMGENRELEFFNNDEIKLSLRSIIAQKKEGGGEKIEGNYSHITEGLIRSAWLLKEKEINTTIYSIPV